MDNQDSPVRAMSELDSDIFGGDTSSMIDFLELDDLNEFGVDFELDDDGQLVANNNNNSNNNNVDDLDVDDPLNLDKFIVDFDFNDDGQPIVSDVLLTGDGASAEQKADSGVSQGEVLSQSIGSDWFSPSSAKRRAGPISGGGHKKQQQLPRSYSTERWKAPPLFRPIRIPSDHPIHSDAVSLNELIAGDYTEVLLTTYLLSGKFILDALPRLKTVPLLIVQGLKDKSPAVANLRTFMATRNPRAVVYTPKTIHIGLHHSKMILLKYRTGVRVVIMTCNMRMDCWAGRCQAAWYQDFPFKTATGACSTKRKRKGKQKGKQKASAAASAWEFDEGKEEDDEGEEDKGEEDEDEDGGDEVIVTSEFEITLIDYFDRVGGPAATFGRSLEAYDFSSANVVLIPSVPGRHFGKNLYRYGHMRVRDILRKEVVHVRPGNHRVLFQVASIMNLSKKPYKWLGEITESFMAEKAIPGQVAEADRPSTPKESEEKGSDEKKEEKDQKGKTPRKPLGQPRFSLDNKGIYQLRVEKRERREMLRRRNVLGILPRKEPKPKRPGKRALKRKRLEERRIAERESKIVYVGKERKREWYSKFLRILWPSEESIRLSNLGWESGMGMPCLTTTLFEGGFRKSGDNFYLNRVMTELKPLLSRWTGAVGMNRHDAMPHLNTYCRYRELKRSDGTLKISKDGMAYFLLGSHSLHRMSWGYLEHRKPPQLMEKPRLRFKPLDPPKPDTVKPYAEEIVQLDVKSFDMGIMFLPSRLPPKNWTRRSGVEGDDGSGLGDSIDGGVRDGVVEATPTPTTTIRRGPATVAATAASAAAASAASAAAAAASAAAEAEAEAEARARPFSCDPEGDLYRLRPLSYCVPDEAPTDRLRTLPLGLLPIPYQLPPEPYEYTRTFGYRVVDRPWCWNRDHALPDKFGNYARARVKVRRNRLHLQR